MIYKETMEGSSGSKVELVVMLEALRLLSFNNLTSQIPAYSRKRMHFLHPIRTLQNSTHAWVKMANRIN